MHGKAKPVLQMNMQNSKQSFIKALICNNHISNTVLCKNQTGHLVTAKFGNC